MIEYDQLFELVQSRRSIRRYTSEPVSTRTVQRLLAVATWAPSAHNRQPWRFVVVASANTKAILAEAMGERLRADRLADGDPLPLIEADVHRSYTRITTATIVIIICLTMKDMDKYPDARRDEAEYTMAVQGTAMATQNLLLAAHAEGLGACWSCAPLFSSAVVRSVLGLPPDWEPQGLITLGHPAASVKPASRNDVEAVSLWR